MKPIDGVILDFDGTLAPEVPEVAVGVLYDCLSAWRPVTPSFLREYFRSVSAFRMDQALELLLASLGLSDKRGVVAAALTSARGHGSWSVGLDPAVGAFVAARPRGSVKIFSSGGATAPRFAPLAALLPPTAFLVYPDRSKADPATWRAIAADQRWDVGRRVVVDDSPPALAAAKVAGYLTVMRTNTVFTERDAREYSRWIDYRVGSIAELAARFKP